MKSSTEDVLTNVSTLAHIHREKVLHKGSYSKGWSQEIGSQL